MIYVEKNKFLTVLKGTVFVIIISLSFAYLRTFFPMTTQNTNAINSNIDRNFIKLVLPLFFSPIVEELIFRKYIPYLFDDVLKRKKAIFLSNIIFSFMHLDPFFLPYLVNGLIYSYFFETTKDIRVPICIHISYNAFVFIVTYL